MTTSSEWMRLRVQSLSHEAEGTVGVALVDPTGAPLPTWTAGSHVTVQLKPGLERQYSLCGEPDDMAYRIAVRHRPLGRGGSDFIARFLRVGSLIEVRPPLNHFVLEPAPAYFFIAAGIGITPIIAMMREARAPWRALYLGRSREDTPLLDAIAAFAGRVRVRFSADEGRADIGAELAELPITTHIYACGPARFVEEIRRCADLRGLPTPRYERFEAPPNGGHRSSPAFDVECARSGRTVHVDERVSILDALSEAGISIPGSCREGICGTCEVRVLEGNPDHRDHIYDSEERDRQRTIATCVSRSSSDLLVLDV